MSWPAWVVSRTLLPDDGGLRFDESSWSGDEPPLVDSRFFRRDKKKQRFIDLIERFYRQLRYGCNTPTCRCSTCFTAQSRRKQGAPHRRPTPTSARVMATLLASTDDPSQHLCPDVPKYGDGSDMALPASAHLNAIFSTRAVSEASTGLDRSLVTNGRMLELVLENCQDAVGTVESQKQDAVGITDTTKVGGRARRSCQHDEEDAKIDTRAFLQVLFNTTAWKLARVVHVRGDRYTLLPPPIPTPTTPIEDQPSKGRDPRTRFLFPSGFDQSSQAPSMDVIVDRLANDVGTSEALFRAFGTQGCPEGIIGRIAPYYNIEQTVSHFVRLRGWFPHSDLVFLALYEDCSVAYRRDHAMSSHQIRNQHARLESFKAAHVVNVCLGAILSSFQINQAWKSPLSYRDYLLARARGIYLPHVPPGVQLDPWERQGLDCSWLHQDMMSARLMRRLLRIIASRTMPKTVSKEDVQNFVQPIVDFIASYGEFPESGSLLTIPAIILLEWGKTLFQQSWDNEAVFCWTSDTGCAIEFIQILYTHRLKLSLDPLDFICPFLSKRLDMMEIPTKWMIYRRAMNHDHLLSFPWLFPSDILVTYFRAINHSLMLAAFHAAASIRALAKRPFRLSFLVDGHERHIQQRLDIAMREHLVLHIRRDRILEDALDQLFRRQKREIRRPLKIFMGMQEGEEGVDMGGVQQEFFRLALGEATNPAYGVFTVDETTRMTWFYPASKTPLDRFTLLGLMFGLAVYNGITLSVTFPLAFYRKLLGLPVNSLAHIEDGWPDLARGLKALLDYSGADVADTIMRSYVFSVEANGMTWSVDMNKQEDREETLARSKNSWPPSSDTSVESALEENAKAEQASMVNNDNREQYVEDYIHWLTDKSVHAQWKAFEAGFFMCVDRKPLSMFSAEALRDLVEGYQSIDVEDWQQAATYDGYDESHPRIQDFWEVVRNFSPAETRQLLAFVTASDRVPVKGIRHIAFTIVKSGDNDQRLPTSYTCFSRLLMPVYSSREILEERLRMAIHNSLGFGTA